MSRRPKETFPYQDMVVLIVGDSNTIDDDVFPEDSIKKLPKASAIAGPLTELINKIFPHVNFSVKNIIDENSTRCNDTSMYLMLIDSLINAQKPSILVVPDIFTVDENLKCIQNYSKMLLMSKPCIVLDARRNAKNEYQNFEAIPVIKYDFISSSWEDVSEKLLLALNRLKDQKIIDYRNLVRGFSMMGHSSVVGSQYLGNVFMVYSDMANPKNKINRIYSLSGNFNDPISMFEYIEKLWMNPNISDEELNPNNTIVVRSGAMNAKIIIANITSNSVNMAKDFKIVEL